MVAGLETLRLWLLGDIFLGGDLSPIWYRNEIDPFAELEHLIEPDDIVYANLENVFFQGPQRPQRGSHLWAPPQSVQALKKLGLNIAGFANNHVMDYGATAMMRSMELLADNGISPVGAGWTLEQATQGIILEHRGWKLGFLAYTTDAYQVRSIVANRFSVGCAPMKTRQMRADLARLRPQVDVLCVGLHWGYEFIQIPSVRQRVLAVQLIGWGADILIGTHPHVIQGFEFIQDRPVFYSLGNLIFPEHEKLDGSRRCWDLINNQSIAGVVEVRMANGQLNFSTRVVPLEYKFPQIHLLQGQELAKFMIQMELLNWGMIGDEKARSLIDQARKEERCRDAAWHKGIFGRGLRRIVLEPALNWLGPNRVAAFKYRLKGRA